MSQLIKQIAREYREVLLVLPMCIISINKLINFNPTIINNILANTPPQMIREYRC